MSSIDIYIPGSMATRQAGRSLTRINCQAAIEIAQVRAQAAVQAAKAEAIGGVGQRAMQEIAFVSQIEQQFGQAVPLAVTRLQAIGDLTALAIGMVVNDTAARLRGL